MRIGKVAIEIYRGSYRLRYRFNGKTESITISGRLESQSLAYRVAAQLNDDLSRGEYDVTKSRYDVRYQKERTPEYLNLLGCWELYKQLKQDTAALTSQNGHWVLTDNALAYLSPRDYDLDRAIEAVTALKRKYALTTLSKIGTLIRAAIKLAFNHKKIPYWVDYPFPSGKKVANLSSKIYSLDEVKLIIEYFTNTYSIKHYANFIEFNFLLGRRPEDIIALTWNDINGNRALIDKAFCNGILKKTKIGRITNYPLNDEMLACLDRQPRTGDIIFPNKVGTYIGLGYFTQSIWKPAINTLVEQGKLKECLNYYKFCRHSRATHLLREGVDLQTIAELLETSVTMLQRHYLQGNTDIVLPNLH
jgi:integrase